MKRFFTLAALVAGFAIGGPSLAQTPAQPSTAAANPPAPSAAAAVSRFTLPNGLTVIVKPDRRAPTAVHMLWLRVGAMDEVDGTSGVAHVLEHMMFKGTPDVKPGEFSRRVAAMGGRENAFTSRDYTGYFQQIPANRLEDVMKLEADRFARNQWADEEFVKELEVVKEERRLRTEDNPRALLYENLNASAFHASPYRRPVVGWMSDLDAMTPGDARAFWQRWYVPANAAVVVAGDVDPQEVLRLAEKYYGPIPARAVPARKPREEPQQQGLRRFEFKAPAEQAYVALAFKVPRLTSLEASPENDDALARTGDPAAAGAAAGGHRWAVPAGRLPERAPAAAAVLRPARAAPEQRGAARIDREGARPWGGYQRLTFQWQAVLHPAHRAAEDVIDGFKPLLPQEGRGRLAAAAGGADESHGRGRVQFAHAPGQLAQ